LKLNCLKISDLFPSQRLDVPSHRGGTREATIFIVIQMAHVTVPFHIQEGF
jgi:hypothetical protein